MVLVGVVVTVTQQVVPVALETHPQLRTLHTEAHLRKAIPVERAGITPLRLQAVEVVGQTLVLEQGVVLTQVARDLAEMVVGADIDCNCDYCIC